MSINFKNVSFAYENNIIFEKFNFSLPDNGVTGVIGQSGSGKTTLIGLMTGLLKPQEGVITGLNKNFSVVFQEDRLLNWLSVLDNVTAVNSDINLCTEILTELGLGEVFKQLPSSLSGGMMRRVALARALAYCGDIFIFDEPFKGLDDKTKADAIKTMKKYVHNKPCVFITHDINEVENICDRVIILDKKPINNLDLIDIKKFVY